MNRVIGITAALGLWWIGALLANSPALSAPDAAIGALARLLVSGEGGRHAVASLTNIVFGFSAAVITGIACGIGIAQSRLIRAALMPLVEAVRPIAALSLFPALIVLLGLGTTAKAFVIFWTAYPAILLNTVHGLDHIERAIIEAATLDGANPAALLRYIRLPLAWAVIMTGVRIGMGGGWISVVAAEMLGASQGIGYAIMSYSQTFRYPEMYGMILLTAILGLAMNTGIKLFQDASVRALLG